MRYQEFKLKESKDDKLIIRISRLLYDYLIKVMEDGVDDEEYLGTMGDIINLDWKSIENGNLISSTEIWVSTQIPDKAQFRSGAGGKESILVFNQEAFDLSSDDDDMGMGRDDKRDIATIAHELRHLLDHVRQGSPDKPYSKSRMKGDPDDEYYSSTAEINARVLEVKSHITYALEDITKLSNEQLLDVIEEELAEAEIEEYIPGGRSSKAWKQIIKRLFVHGRNVLAQNKKQNM